MEEGGGHDGRFGQFPCSTATTVRGPMMVDLITSDLDMIGMREKVGAGWPSFCATSNCSARWNFPWMKKPRISLLRCSILLPTSSHRLSNFAWAWLPPVSIRDGHQFDQPRLSIDRIVAIVADNPASFHPDEFIHVRGWLRFRLSRPAPHVSNFSWFNLAMLRRHVVLPSIRPA